MPASHESSNDLAASFAQYGVESFLESTSLLVALLDKEGQLISWNPSFALIRQAMPESLLLRDFLASPSRDPFDGLLADALRQRARAQGDLKFAYGDWAGDYETLLVPLPGERALFIAEPIHDASDLEAVTAELQKAQKSLKRRQTELKAVIAQANEVSHTDSLTFLPNRRQIIGDLQREVIFSDRYGTPLAISLLDLDHFKSVNDTYGHVVGDEVLQKVAGELRDHIRHPDTIGRYGGEEFLLVLPHSTIKAAAEQAERLCRNVRSLVIQSGGHDISLTISIGVAQYKVHGEDWQGFLNRADRALYKAKDDGRDQWVVAEK